jgi:hypothetical protein
MIREVDESNELMLLTRINGEGVVSPASHPTADPTIGEHEKASETLMRRVQSLVLYPSTEAELIKASACHDTLNKVPDV